MMIKGYVLELNCFLKLHSSKQLLLFNCNKSAQTKLAIKKEFICYTQILVTYLTFVLIMRNE